MNPKITGFLGYGEIGSSLRECLTHNDPDAVFAIYDHALGMVDDLPACDFVHVAVPQPALFTALAEHKWGEKQDQILIVHTTTRPGDTKVVADHYQQCFKGVYHAPVRGRHPDLSQSLQTFSMHVTGPQGPLPEVIEHLQSMNIYTDYWGEDYVNTELAKQLSTLRFAWEIMWRKHLQSLCDDFGADSALVNDVWTRAYNEGYNLLGLEHFRRSVLEHVPGPIGGHCVWPNAQLMKDDSEIAAWIDEMQNFLTGCARTAAPEMQISVK